jgi:S1-C subfamily serine protease
VEQILKFGQVMRPSLGIGIAPSQVTRQLGTEGVLVLEVQRGGPADIAGLKGTFKDEYGRIILGDIIVEMKGVPIKDDNDLFDTLDGCKVGEIISVKLLRNGRGTATVDLALGARSTQLEQGLD